MLAWRIQRRRVGQGKTDFGALRIIPQIDEKSAKLASERLPLPQAATTQDYSSPQQRLWLARSEALGRVLTKFGLRMS
ncbi:MAG: hypothetical protein KDK05_29045 [Candidatus Competibacteraceae bacterium]|nr:hypothetical protein [Candidatus Competibacteraceae bacterium]